jgi:hypothetical protein
VLLHAFRFGYMRICVHLLFFLMRWLRPPVVYQWLRAELLEAVWSSRRRSSTAWPMNVTLVWGSAYVDDDLLHFLFM